MSPRDWTDWKIDSMLLRDTHENTSEKTGRKLDVANSLHIEGIPSTSIDNVWEDVVPLISQALEYSDGCYSIRDVKEGLQQRKMQLWLVPGGVWVTQIVQYPQSKRLEIMFAAGKFREWTEHLETVKHWGRELGCDALQVTGRPGWGRKLHFKEISRTFRVKL